MTLPSGESLPPVLLVHGWGGSFDHTWARAGWPDILGDSGRTCLGVDLLGHGTAPKRHDPAAYARLDQRVWEGITSEPVDAVGFSLGGAVLLGMAAERPQAFRRLVIAGLGDNLFRPDGEDQTEFVRSAVGNDSEESRHPLGRAFRLEANREGNDVDALLACLDRPRTPVRDILDRVTVPVLVAIGDRDFAGPGDPLVAALPDARLCVLPRVDHARTPGSFELIDAAIAFLGEG